MFITLIHVYYADRVLRCGVEGSNGDIAEDSSLKGCDGCVFPVK
jgi:hypothetical protein